MLDAVPDAMHPKNATQDAMDATDAISLANYLRASRLVPRP